MKDLNHILEECSINSPLKKIVVYESFVSKPTEIVTERRHNKSLKKR